MAKDDSDETVKQLFGCVGAWGALLVLAPLFTIAHAWLTVTMWRWFVVATFHVSTLSIPAAVGISCILSIHKISSYIKKEFKESYTSIITQEVTRYFMCWLMAYIAHLYMAVK